MYDFVDGQNTLHRLTSHVMCYIVVCEVNAQSKEFTMLKKRYAEWTAEEKAAYKAKKVAYLTKRNEDLTSNFAALRAELEKAKVSKKVMELLSACEKGSVAKKGAVHRDTYLTQVFGTEEPAIGQTATYLYIGVRGPNGERLGEKESIRDFVTRLGDIKYAIDANTISSMVWYLRKRGYKIDNNRDLATVTFLGKEEAV